MPYGSEVETKRHVIVYDSLTDRLKIEGVHGHVGISSYIQKIITSKNFHLLITCMVKKLGDELSIFSWVLGV